MYLKPFKKKLAYSQITKIILQVKGQKHTFSNKKLSPHKNGMRRLKIIKHLKCFLILVHYHRMKKTQFLKPTLFQQNTHNSPKNLTKSMQSTNVIQ